MVLSDFKISLDIYSDFLSANGCLIKIPHDYGDKSKYIRANWYRRYDKYELVNFEDDLIDMELQSKAFNLTSEKFFNFTSVAYIYKFKNQRMLSFLLPRLFPFIDGTENFLSFSLDNEAEAKLYISRNRVNTVRTRLTPISSIHLFNNYTIEEKQNILRLIMSCDEASMEVAFSLLGL